MNLRRVGELDFSFSGARTNRGMIAVLAINLAHQVFPDMVTELVALLLVIDRRITSMYAKVIALRYLSILTSLAEMVEGDEMLSDLSHPVVKSCLATMRMAGADSEEIYRMFGCSIREIYEHAVPEREKYRNVLQSAYTHVLSLLSRKECLFL